MTESTKNTWGAITGVIVAIVVIVIIVLSVKHKQSATTPAGIVPNTTTTSSKSGKTTTTTTKTSSSTTSGALTAPGPGSAPVAPVVSTDGDHVGFIKSITTTNGVTKIVIDYVTLSSCPTGAVATTCVGGYQVSNDSTYLRTFPVSATAPITVQTFSTDKTGQYNFNQNMTEYVFASLFNTPLPHYNPKNIVYNISLKNQEVISISEVYKH